VWLGPPAGGAHGAPWLRERKPIRRGVERKRKGPVREAF
jgi:hypothetical protein